MIRSLKTSRNRLSDPACQLEILNRNTDSLRRQPRFFQKLEEEELFPLKPTGIEIFQMNLGYMCNMTCNHCHVDAGPDRREVMSRETLELCLQAIRGSGVGTVDLTGGAPEMNPHFRWFVEQAAGLGKKVIVRSNLTILTTAPRYRSLPEFFARHGVEVTCSLPCYSRERTDRQRGEGAYERSVEAMKMLNRAGYGMEEGDLKLNLVYNPVGPSLPGSQRALERDYKEELHRRHGIRFNRLFTITNLPISRYLHLLLEQGDLEEYMEKLITAFNPAAAKGVMCRDTISVSWDGGLYDCDFNQMLEMKVDDEAPQHIRDWNEEQLNRRTIRTDQHCFGCTAGAGSSCGGAIDGD